MRAVQIRPALPVNLVVKIYAFELDFFDDDLAAQLQREWISDFGQRIGAFDGGHELVRPLVVDFQVAEPRRLRVPANAEAPDLRSQSEFAELSFDLSGDIAVEIFGPDIDPGAKREDRNQQDEERNCDEKVLEPTGTQVRRCFCC